MPQWIEQPQRPNHPGWYYVRQESDTHPIGIRYYDANGVGGWWAADADGLRPNHNFSHFLHYPGITDMQDKRQEPARSRTTVAKRAKK